MLFRLTILPAMLVAFVSCPIQAQDVFALRDTNGDDVLSGREAKGLTAVDKDQDGDISRAEFQMAMDAWRPQVAKADDENFRSMDRNEDGRLSGNECTGYEFCDTNADRRITRAEFDEGSIGRRKLVAALSPDEAQRAADEYFKTLDTNEDGRLTGTEVIGMNRYDSNQDGRTSKEEWDYGVLMDALSATSSTSTDDDPEMTPSSGIASGEDLIELMIDAANTQKADTLLSNMRPELKTIVDDVVLQYIVEFIHKHHGRISPVRKTDLQSAPGADPGATRFTANASCEKGTLALSATEYKGKLLGLSYDSPHLDLLDQEIFSDLAKSTGAEDGLTKRFAQYYSPKCVEFVKSVLADKNDEAFEMFHPLVREQIGRAAFDEVFALMQAQCEPEPTIELEIFRIEEDKNGTRMFYVGHRVSGQQSPQMFTAGFQLIGMKAELVTVSIAPVGSDSTDTNEEAKPTTLKQLIEDAWNQVDKSKGENKPSEAPPAAPQEIPALPVPRPSVAPPSVD